MSEGCLLFFYELVGVYDILQGVSLAAQVQTGHAVSAGSLQRHTSHLRTLVRIGVCFSREFAKVCILVPDISIVKLGTVLLFELFLSLQYTGFQAVRGRSGHEVCLLEGFEFFRFDLYTAADIIAD